MHLLSVPPSTPLRFVRCLPVQARGRALLNLRVEDSEGGLMGRTLLTLVSNKGYGGGSLAELPPHKFGPHDVIALRPNKGPAEGPAIVQGGEAGKKCWFDSSVSFRQGCLSSSDHSTSAASATDHADAQALLLSARDMHSAPFPTQCMRSCFYASLVPALVVQVWRTA